MFSYLMSKNVTYVIHGKLEKCYRVHIQILTHLTARTLSKGPSSQKIMNIHSKLSEYD